MPRWLYSLLLYLALPAVTLRFMGKGWRHAAYRGSLRERLAWRPVRRADEPLWLHAASVGEVRALAAFADDPELHRVCACSHEVYDLIDPPPGAEVYFSAIDPAVGALTTYTLINFGLDGRDGR